jgi:hypothetical protein
MAKHKPSTAAKARWLAALLTLEAGIIGWWLFRGKNIAKAWVHHQSAKLLLLLVNPVQ